MVLIGTIVFAFFEELKRNVDADGQKSGTEIELGGKDNASMTENYEMMWWLLYILNIKALRSYLKYGQSQQQPNSDELVWSAILIRNRGSGQG